MQKRTNTRLAESTSIKFFAAYDQALAAGVISSEEAELILDEYRKETNDWQVQCLSYSLQLKINTYARPKDTHAPFQFSVLGETFDVRPLFSVIELGGAGDLVKILDNAIHSLIQHLPVEEFNEEFKSDLYSLRELKNAIEAGSDQNYKEEERNHLVFDHKYLENRSETASHSTALQKSA